MEIIGNIRKNYVLEAFKTVCTHFDHILQKGGEIYRESELLTPGVPLHVTTYPNPGY